MTQRQLTNFQAAIATALVVGGGALLAGGLVWLDHMSAAREEIKTSAEAHCSGTSEDCSRKDLPAQVRAATAAEAMADLSLAQLIVSLGGLVGLGVTVAFSIRATNAAVHASKVAEESLEVARKTARQQLRAYMTLSRAGIAWNNDESTYTLSLEAKNGGQTPAKFSQIVTDVFFMPPDWPAPWTVNFPVSGGSKATVGPGGGQSSIERHAVKPSDLAAWKDGSRHLYVVVEIRYLDAFDEPQYTRSRFYVHGPGQPESMRMFADSIGNEAS